MPYIFENVGKLSNSMSQLMSVGSFVISFVGTYFIFMRLGDKMSRRLLYAIIGGIYVIAWGVWVLPPEMLAMWMLVMFTVLQVLIMVLVNKPSTNYGVLNFSLQNTEQLLKV